MTLRLNGSTSGYAEIDAPAAAGSNTLVLPSSNGSANQFLKNGSTAGTLGYSSMVEDSSGRVLVGTSTTANNLRLDAKLAVVSTGSGNLGGVNLTNYGGTSASTASFIDFNRSRGTSDGSLTSVAQNDILGYLVFRGATGSQYNSFAAITAAVDGTPGNNDSPGRLAFFTTKDGDSDTTEQMRINNDGGIVGGGNVISGNLFSNPGFAFRKGPVSGFEGLSLNKTSTDWGTAIYIHRSFQAGDGTLIEFAHDTFSEGSISVSGTTVSYNGGHLSRWSQTINPNEPNALLKGTVMTNLDEMCEWFKEDGTLEDNEQLNKMAVSSIEGDPNVAGVLVNVDDDGDLNVGMTGDMVIRIADGVTVQRGDLLMSAGDGTAKPQDDDIIRSKTIAKVTSTNVSCTYEDGSYCVPCVLMAC